MSNFDDLTSFFVFGDSLSDTGNSFAITMGAIPPDPPYASGRFSNGLVAVEYLAENLEFEIDPYYDNEVGNNFAVGGATTGSRNSNNDNIALFLPGVTLPGLTAQIDSFEDSLADANAAPDALYLVWAGPNNFLDYLGGGVPDDPAILLQEGINNYVNNLNRLIDLGAKNIVVPNMASLGRLPFSAEFAAEATAITIAYNGGLALALDNLDLEDNSSVEILEVDLFSSNEAIAANPEQFGLSNISDPLLLSGLYPTKTSGFFFWDMFHPTTEAHTLFADTLEQTIRGDITQLSFNHIVGTANTDLIFGTQESDNVDGLAESDFIWGRNGDDRLEGWGGNDLILGGRGNDIIDGGEGGDYLWGGIGDDLLFGSGGNDYVRGHQDRDILIGGDGNDYLWGGSEEDYVLGSNGEDFLWGDRGNDILNGGGGRDVLWGGYGDDLIDGGAGDDILSGNEGTDTFELTANFGTDTITDFDLGSDRLMLYGGLGFADLSFSDHNISVATTNEILAVLSGVDTTTLTESNFI